DAARSARSAWIQKMTDAWKRGRARDASEPDVAERLLRGAPAPHDDPAAAMRSHLQQRGVGSQSRRDAAWRSYKDRLSRAWMGRADPREADRIMRQGERWRGGR